MVRINRITLQNFKSFVKASIPFPSGFNVICGPNGVGKSVNGDTEVLLNTGELRPIKDIVENALKKSKMHLNLKDGIYTTENPDNIKVFGLDPASMKIVEKDVSAFIKRRGDKHLFKLTTRTGKKIITTGCHPVMIFSNNKIHSEVVSNLHEGDFIATPRKLEIPRKIIKFKSKKVNEGFARFVGYLIGDGHIANNRIEIVNANKEIMKDFQFLLKDIFNLKIQYKKKISKTDKAIRLICWNRKLAKFLQELFRSKAKSITSSHKNIPLEFMISSNKVIANLLAAIFDCDAHVRENSGIIEYMSENEKLIDQIHLLLLRFGIISIKRVKIKYATNIRNKKRRYYCLCINGIENLRKFYENIHLKCKHKNNTLARLVERNVIGNPNMDIIPNNVNNIIRECRSILGIYYKPFRKTYPRFATYKYCLTRDGIKEVLSIFNARLKKLNPRKSFYVKSRLERARKLIKILKSLSSSDVFWDQIIKIERVPGEKWVYDLCIPNCHNFIGNGVFIHNSNIVDAITFVLGTTSAKTIRADKLKSLIFNGGKSRKPADHCIVSLYIDNKDKKIPGEEDEIKISRKVSKNGISIYKLNGKTVTRTRILDVLASANLSSMNNIIMQGDVTKVIEMSDIERRGIIDDISGISEFDEKKEKAEKELRTVGERVREMMFIVAEKEKTIKRLKSERDIAERYRRLNSELRKSRASLSRIRLKNIEDKKGTIEKDIKEKSKKLDEIDKQYDNLNSVIEEKEKRLKHLDDKIIKLSEKTRILNKLNELRTELIVKRNKLENNKKEIGRLNTLITRLTMPHEVKEILKRKIKGVYDVFSSLISVPHEYRTAIEVAVGPHKNDIVVENDKIASDCIVLLKREKIGRARFLPLNKIREMHIKNFDRIKKIDGVIGKAIDLIKYKEKFSPAIKHVLGSTLIVNNIETARMNDLDGIRCVTIDGDIKEASGAMIGGYYEERHIDYRAQVKKLKDENIGLRSRISRIQEEIKKLEVEEKEETEEIKSMQEERNIVEKELDNHKRTIKDIEKEKTRLQSIINGLQVEMAKIDVELNNLRKDAKEYKDIKSYYDLTEEELEEKISSYIKEINSLGPINMKAIEEYKTMSVEFKELRKKLDRIIKEKEAIEKTVKEIESKRYDRFMSTLNEISHNFSKIYKDMNGIGKLRLEEEGNIESGLIIEASPSGKRIVNLDAMSGGEKTLTSLAFLFAVMQHSAAPFYILDEIDAALDKPNTKKIDELIKKYSKNVQFIVITHNDTTIAAADKVFGVSMEDGVSRVFGINMPK